MRQACLMLIVLCACAGGCGQKQAPAPDTKRALEDFQGRMEELERYERKHAGRQASGGNPGAASQRR